MALLGSLPGNKLLCTGCSLPLQLYQGAKSGALGMTFLLLSFAGFFLSQRLRKALFRGLAASEQAIVG